VVGGPAVKGSQSSSDQFVRSKLYIYALHIIVSAAQQTLTSMPSNDKLTDLHKDTVDSRPKDYETPLGLTTDYGVKVSATNNWYVYRRHDLRCPSVLVVQQA
jgi:hypothetical protein